MIAIVFYIILTYFLIGAAAITRVNNTGSAKHPNGWMKYFIYLIIVSFVCISIYEGNMFRFVAALIVVTGFYEILRISFKKNNISSDALFLALSIYITFSTGFIFFSEATSTTEKLFLYTLVFTFDGFSQLSGQLFGKRKLAVKISPAKTVGGLVGGILFTVITSVLLSNFMKYDFITSVVIGVAISLSALTGDLLASYFKRLHFVKDYGKIIPGHGGVLDRFDSLIAAGSVFRLCTLLLK